MVTIGRRVGKRISPRKSIWAGGVYLRKRSGTLRNPKKGRDRPAGVVFDRNKKKILGVEPPKGHFYGPDPRRLNKKLSLKDALRDQRKQKRKK